MEWYNSLVAYSLPSPNEDEDESAEKFSDLEKDPDRKLLTLVIEKVLVVKITGKVKLTDAVLARVLDCRSGRPNFYPPPQPSSPYPHDGFGA